MATIKQEIAALERKLKTVKAKAAPKKRTRKNPEIHIDVNSHNAGKSPRAKTNPVSKLSEFLDNYALIPSDLTHALMQQHRGGDIFISVGTRSMLEEVADVLNRHAQKGTKVIVRKI